MQRRIRIGAVALALSLMAPFAARAPLAQSVAAEASAPAVRGRVIVKYRESSSLTQKQALTAAGKRLLQAQTLADRIGMPLTAGIGLGERSQVVKASGISSADLAARIAADPDVEYAVADEKKHIVALPNDPFYTTRPYSAFNGATPPEPTAGGPLVGQWYLKPPQAGGTPSSINAEQAWDVTTGNPAIVVAVLDTGLRFDHPDLQGGNVLRGYDMVSQDADGTFATANDGDGRDADASDPGDFVSSTDTQTNPTFGRCDVQPRSSWHGTETLGLIGAQTDNVVGIAGLGRNVRVMPVRVLGKCGGYDSDILAGVRWAAGLAVPDVPANPTPARVINLSLGGPQSCSQAYVDTVAAVNAVGTVVVASAGNSAGHAVSSPANCPGVIGVAGLRHVGSKVGFSDLGPQISISAPAGNCVNASGPCLYPIMSLSNAGTTAPAPGGTYTDAFNASIGTSFSAPLVAGTAALMLSVQPALSPADVRARLQSSAAPFPTSGSAAGTPVCSAPNGADQLECYCTTATCGAGMLDAHTAVLAASGTLARIRVATATPTFDQPVVFAAAPIAGPGRSIVSYQWTIVDPGTTGAAIAAGGGAADSVTVNTAAPGSFTVRLAVTDDGGAVATTETTVALPAPPSSSGGGGGALGIGWLLLLLSAVLALAAANRWPRQVEPRWPRPHQPVSGRPRFRPTRRR